MEKKFMVLIVDDNESFANRIVTMLEELDTVGNIEVAMNYKEGHRLFIEQKPNVVLLDISLPGKSGIELLKLIKQSEWICEVIMITNHSGSFYRQLCSDLGAGYFLDKTYDFDLVPEIISQQVLN